MNSDKLLLPRYYTPPLSEEFTSDGSRLINVFSKVWKNPQTGRLMQLEDWQIWLLNRMLERFPKGHKYEGEIRYRQIVVILPRQSGKSLIAAALTLYALFAHARTPIVIGTAGHSAEQATIVFGRLKDTIMSVPQLKAKFKRKPGLRVMTLTSGGSYAVFPASGNAVQGQDLTFAILDELHLAKPELWSALVFGQRAQDMSVLTSITTAGDDSSDLLNTLTMQGRELAVNPDPDSRFGFFEWSCPTEQESKDLGIPVIPWNSEEAILCCNPRVVSGAIPIERIMQENKYSSESEVRRYALNQPTKSRTLWMDLSSWRNVARKWAQFPPGVIPSVVAIELTSGGTYASVTLAGMDDKGKVHTQLHASIPNPATSYLVTMIRDLTKEYPDLQVATDSLRGKDIAAKLAEDGIPVRTINLNEVAESISWVFNAVKRKAITHCNASVINMQVKYAQAKALPRGGYRLISQNNQELDAIYSTIFAAYTCHRVHDEGANELPFAFG